MMTSEEVKKALKICDDCPYDGTTKCIGTLLTEAREHIIEQENEIEKLKNEFKQLETNAEILARGVRDLNHENYELTEKIKQAKIDVLNELKKKKSIAIWDIDEMIAEVQNAEDKS